MRSDGTLQCYYDDEFTPYLNGKPGHQWLSMRTWNGSAWVNRVTVSKANDPFLSRDGMASVVELSFNNLFCVIESLQTLPPEYPDRGCIRYVTSADGGATWSEREILYEPEYEEDDDGEWIDINGKIIPRDASIQRLFQRVPKWNEEGTDFKVKAVEWPELERRAKKWNEEHPDDKRTAAEMFARVRLENQILQAKGSSLYHAQHYEDQRDQRDRAKKEKCPLLKDQNNCQQNKQQNPHHKGSEFSPFGLGALPQGGRANSLQTESSNSGQINTDNIGKCNKQCIKSNDRLVAAK